ncbi:FAD-dependent oxidoreductase [Companilactobacillus bobalius]|uniref:FAD-dependent oxidoreductase n=1 Tax=Companilactobacillus bobalius TaxID=2801451 RepID=UPI002279A5E5|nr:FAD-dependent oxidoreductase [Companilactobacillus bobalius]
MHIGGAVKDLGDVFYAIPEEFVKKGVHMRMQHDVIKIDAQAHTILAQNLKTREFLHDKYDKLIMATGSRTSIPVIAGIENPKVMLCKTCNQAHHLSETSKNNHKIAVLGGGYAGVELAEGFVKSGHEVVLFQRNKQLLDEYVDATISDRVKKLLEDNHVNVLTGTDVTRFSDTEDKHIKISTENSEYIVDMVAISPGVLPQSDLLKGQVNIAKNGAIITNAYMQTSDPNIFAAGDVTEIQYNPTLTSKYIPLASHAVRQGTLAGMNLFKRRRKSMGSQATSGMLLFGQTIACTGLTLDAAKEANYDAHHVFFESNYRPDFMPTNTKINIELVYDRKSRRVLGAQFMSSHEVVQSDLSSFNIH